jgi:hypothetical protein
MDEFEKLKLEMNKIFECLGVDLKPWCKETLESL